MAESKPFPKSPKKTLKKTLKKKLEEHAFQICVGALGIFLTILGTWILEELIDQKSESMKQALRQDQAQADAAAHWALTQHVREQLTQVRIDLGVIKQLQARLHDNHGPVFAGPAQPEALKPEDLEKWKKDMMEAMLKQPTIDPKVLEKIRTAESMRYMQQQIPQGR